MASNGRQDTRPASLLLEEDRKKALSWVSPDVVEAFATLYAEAAEFRDEELEAWLDQNLLMAMSRKGMRSVQVVEVTKGEQAAKLARERHLDPTFINEAPKEEKKRGWGG